MVLLRYLFASIAIAIEVKAFQAPINKTRYSNSLNHLHLIRETISKFNGSELIICVVVREPFVIYNEPIEETAREISQSKDGKFLLSAMENLDNYSGVAIEVTKRLAEIFKFKVRVVRPADGQFGVLDASGTWTGLMGSVVRNESQLGVTALSITSSRAEAVDFTRAYYVETSAILLKIPEEVQDFAVIIEPFSPIVWYSLFVTIIFLILVIMLMTRLEDNERLKHQIAKAMRQRAHRPSRLMSTDELMRIACSHAMPNQKSNMAGSIASSIIESELNLDEIVLEKSEFGSNWTERFYYSLTCVLNILLNKGS